MSEKTIRNWIRSGKLSAERSADGFRIPVDQLEPFRGAFAPESAPHANGVRAEPPHTNGSADHPRGGHPRNGADGAEAAEWAALVRHLTQQNLEMAGRLGYLQAELAQARERILALEAPKDPIAPPPPAGAIFRPLPAEPKPPRRPWWRFWG